MQSQQTVIKINVFKCGPNMLLNFTYRYLAMCCDKPEKHFQKLGQTFSNSTCG